MPKPPPITLDGLHGWPQEWEPRGWSRDLWSRLEPHEPFADWWTRWAATFPHVDSRVLEQWVHAHWDHSPYFGFPIQDFHSDLRGLSTTVLLTEVGREGREADEDPSDAAAWYDAFSRNPLYAPMTAKGTWDMPLLLVESPSGFVYNGEMFTGRRYWLLEGHRRYDFLRGLEALGKAAAMHDVLVLRQRRPGDRSS